MPVTDNQDIVNELEALLRQVKEKPCPDNFVTANSSGGADLVCPHDEHNRRGTITDPRLQAAWELLVCHNLPMDHIPGHAWYVDNWPDGPVRGLLEQVVETIWPGGSFPYGFGGKDAVMALVGAEFRWGDSVPSLGKAIKVTIAPDYQDTNHNDTN